MLLRPVILAGSFAVALQGCSDSTNPLPTEAAPSFHRAQMAPGPLVSIPVGQATEQIWPFATANLSSSDDPINLVFTGQAKPRQIRNALLGLDGARGAPFPPVFPFDCTWSDAIGGLMAGYGEAAGWAGGAIQLQCGDYGPVRFHIRLFDLGAFTIANAHFEVLIPGTADHQVLSWELAEQLVTYDLARSGLLGAAPGSTGLIGPAPTHRVIPAIIYSSLGDPLRQLIGGPPPSGADVGIATDGQATVLTLAGEASPAPAETAQHFTVSYDQVVPKPFCSSGPADFVLVQGQVQLDQDVTAPAGDYRMRFRAAGMLAVTPIDISSGQPAGVPLSAHVSEWQASQASASGGTVTGEQRQALEPRATDGTGQLFILFNVGLEREPRYSRQETCQGR